MDCANYFSHQIHGLRGRHGSFQFVLLLQWLKSVSKLPFGYFHFFFLFFYSMFFGDGIKGIKYFSDTAHQIQFERGATAYSLVNFSEQTNEKK